MEWSEVGCTTQTGFGDVRVGRVVPDGDASGLDAVGGDGVLRAGAFETVAVFRVVNAGHATVMAGRGAQLREMFPHAVGLRAVTKRMYHVTQLTVDISKVFDGGLLPGKMRKLCGCVWLTRSWIFRACDLLDRVCGEGECVPSAESKGRYRYGLTSVCNGV